MKDDYIYLDYAAATPLDERVFDAMRPYLLTEFYNPSSPYTPALQVRRDYEDAKHRIAQTIGAKADELVMTAGATESVNIAFAATDGHVITSNIEHQSVLASAKARPHTLIEPDETGRVSATAVAEAITSETQLISMALANNELGTIQPLKEISQAVIAERHRRLAGGDKTPIYLHSDASQGLGLIDVNVARLGIDMLTLNAAKVYGPKQVGLLWLANHVRAAPTILGGGQERGIRGGTENVAGVIGFATAIERAEKKRKTESKRIAGLRNTLRATIVDEIPQAVISGSPKHQLPNFLHISFPGIDAERLIFMLETKGVYVTTSSACAANKRKRPYVLEAVGLKPDVINGSLRITLGKQTTDERIERAAREIIAAVTSEYDRIRPS